MKATRIFLVLWSMTTPIFGQKDSTARPFTASRANAITIDFGANSPIVALNYRRNVKQFTKSFIEASAGVGVGYQPSNYRFNFEYVPYFDSAAPLPQDAGFRAAVPHGIMYVMQRGKRTFWEVGYSAVYLTQKRFGTLGGELRSGYLPGLALGYRFQSPKTGLMLRIYGQSNYASTQTFQFRALNDFVRSTTNHGILSFGISIGKSF